MRKPRPKQWERCSEGFGDKAVTRVNGGLRDVLHPSVQVMQYRTNLWDSHTAFYEGDRPIGLSSCAYLYDYAFKEDDILFSERFGDVLSSEGYYCPRGRMQEFATRAGWHSAFPQFRDTPAQQIG